MSSEPEGELLAIIKKCEQVAPRRHSEQPSFWVRVHAPDASLLRALIEGNLSDQVDAVLQQYREVFQTRSTAYERESVLNQLDFQASISPGRDRIHWLVR